MFNALLMQMTPLKLQLALQAGAFLLIFGLVFVWFYRSHFQESEERRLFWWTILLVAVIAAAKFGIFYLSKGYLPDRALFYALPSPKFSGLLWLFPLAASLFALYRWSPEWKDWSSRKFLAALWVIFVLFSLGVAGLREGSATIRDPFTRTDWEYSGALPLVGTAPEFLAAYTSIQSRLPAHAQTHPPGYILILYFLQRIFHANLLWLAFLTIILGGLFIVPVYYFWRWFFSEEETRVGLSVLIFIPSIVLFSATSMDFFMLLFFWSALAAVYEGWKRDGFIAFLGGLLAGLALFMNFLFLLFGLVLAFFFVRLLMSLSREEKKILLVRGGISLVGFLSFAGLLYFGTGYSFVENFFLANSVHHTVLDTGASSLVLYGIFALVNLIAFVIYLGLPIGLLLKNRARAIFSSVDWLVLLPLAAVAFLIISGLFQGEVERLWLFLIPLFVAPLIHALRDSRVRASALVSLLVFQAVVMQILFYTYW